MNEEAELLGLIRSIRREARQIEAAERAEDLEDLRTCDWVEATAVGHPIAVWAFKGEAARTSTIQKGRMAKFVRDGLAKPLPKFFRASFYPYSVQVAVRFVPTAALARTEPGR